jgi:hypothetical protein
MQRLCLFFLFIVIALAACTPDVNGMPADFSVELAWNTGSLPPEHTYNYIINIGPEMQGVLEYQFGYGDSTNNNSYSEEFQITQEVIEQLYYDLQDMFREDWEVGETADGGPASSLTLSAYNTHYHIPSLSKLSSDDYARMDAAIETIRNAVPVELWQEMQTRQQNYEKNYEY